MPILFPLLAVAALLGGYEVYAIVAGRPTITDIVRGAARRYPPTGFLVGLGAGLLLAHFFWQ